MSTLLSMGVTHYRPLYIHQVFPSFPFSMFSQGLAHLSVQTVGIAFQYHSRLNWLFHSALCTERLWLRDMTRAELDRSQLGVKLWTFGIGVELVCDFWGLVSFCENEVQGGFFVVVFFNGWWTLSFPLDWFLYCRAISSLSRVCTSFFFVSHSTCGTNAKLQDRRLWVWIYFLECKWFSCVNTEDSLQ